MPKYAYSVSVTKFLSVEGFLKSIKCIDLEYRKIFSNEKVFFPIKEDCKDRILRNIINRFGGNLIKVNNFFPKRFKKAIKLAELEEKFQISLPRSFMEIGDCIFINEIPKESIKDRKFIGEIFLKNFSVRAVFLKKDIFSGEFRVPKWERIAGFGDTFTVHKENRFYYAVDLSKAFFNPRMGNERIRVVGQVNREETVLDMFSGVGPFSIPIAKRGAIVYSFDKNPYAIRYLEMNVKLNNVKGKFWFFNDDVKEAPKYINSPINRFIMNYPEKSIDFLYLLKLLPIKRSAVVHLYIFARGVDKKDLIKDVIEYVSEKFIENGIKNFKFLYKKILKEVAPRKYIVSLDILLTR